MVNIYIETEVKARELTKNLYLGLMAAQRGHHVLVGHMKARLSHGDLRHLPAGIYHDKSLVPDDTHRRKHRELNRRNFAVTVQDEEHGLNSPDYSGFARRRFDPELLEDVKAVFAWGPHDFGCLRHLFPNHTDRFLMVGSPRVDLWREEFRFFRRASADAIGVPRNRFILLVSNLGGPMNVNSLPRRIAHLRDSGAHLDDCRLSRMIEREEKKTRLLGHFIAALSDLSARFPESQIIVRPHPTESEGYWKAMIGNLANVSVRSKGALSSWVERSGVVVQNGCTSAYECSMSGRPLVSYCPEGIGKEMIPNRLGRYADSLEALGTAILEMRKDGYSSQSPSEEQGKLLDGRLANTHGQFAAESIVDFWDSFSQSLPGSTIGGAHLRPRMGWSGSRNIRIIRRSLGSIAARFSFGRKHSSEDQIEFITQHKFPVLTPNEVFMTERGISACLNMTDQVTARIVDERLVLLSAS